MSENAIEMLTVTELLQGVVDKLARQYGRGEHLELSLPARVKIPVGRPVKGCTGLMDYFIFYPIQVEDARWIVACGEPAAHTILRDLVAGDVIAFRALDDWDGAMRSDRAEFVDVKVAESKPFECSLLIASKVGYLSTGESEPSDRLASALMQDHWASYQDLLAYSASIALGTVAHGSHPIYVAPAMYKPEAVDILAGLIYQALAASS